MGGNAYETAAVSFGNNAQVMFVALLTAVVTMVATFLSPCETVPAYLTEDLNETETVPAYLTQYKNENITAWVTYNQYNAMSKEDLRAQYFRLKTLNSKP